MTRPPPDAGPSEEEVAQRDVAQVRAEVSDTVEELAHRVDVPQRLRDKRAETTQRVQAQVAHAREIVAEKGPVLQRTLQQALRERPAVVGGVLAVLLLVFLRSMRRRTHRKEDADGTR
jgi:hypothetical protein